MTIARLYHWMIWISFPLALGIFVALLFVTAPYGRHKRRGWGPSVSNRLGWILMESPTAILFLVFFSLGSAPKSLTSFIFLAMWEAHYFHRAFIYPFRISRREKSMPVTIPFMGILFNIGNTFINGSYLFELSGGYPQNWLNQPQMVIGLLLFLTGFGINLWADGVLRALRIQSQNGYQIPEGGLFRFVSCPNYLGEIIEWIGWAVATWSLPGLAFAVWTFANLAPRARAHHAWYRRNFPGYPARRKALIPGIW